MASPYAFLVEGRDDLYVIERLWRFHQQREFPCSIEPKEGINRLLDDLRVRLKPQDSDLNLERLGIVVDADGEEDAVIAPASALNARWTSLHDILVRSGYTTVPKGPSTDGTIIEQTERPIVGIWIMPNNTDSGMLEDFIRSLIPQTDALLGRAEDCLNELPAEHRRFRMHHRSKALIHTWLAWQEEPGRPFGQAIQARYLDAMSPDAQQLIAWLKRLFEA